MLEVDLHMHTNRSLCGLHTLLEMTQAAQDKGLKGIAITDHGTALGGPGVNSVFLRRFPSHYQGLKVWKGIEANILPQGEIDVPKEFISELDLILVGLHPNITHNQGEGYYTDLLLNCIDKNSVVDVITHPDIKTYPVDIKRVVSVAAKKNIAVEFNNSNILYQKTDLTKMKEMVDAVKETGCQALLSGDAHAIQEIGADQDLLKIFKEENFPCVPFVNQTFESALKFVNARKKRREQFNV
ncbi:PHP domain-containing protein [Candidatus Auribacterota bacterium]